MIGVVDAFRTAGKALRSTPARYILPEVVGGYLKPYSNRRLFTTFVVCFATFQPAFPQTAQWIPFNAKEAHFSVSFCGTPTTDPPTVQTKGAITGTVRLFKAGGENYFCMVGYSEYNIIPAMEEELLLNQTNFIKAVNGTVGTSRRTEFVNGPSKLPALVFTFEMPPNHTGKSIVILKGSRVYQLIFTYRKTMDYTAMQQKFLNSFEIAK